MKRASLRPPQGQAAAEMMLVLPLILLMAAGLFQFALLSVCRIQFDDACGQAAREWASGARTSQTLAEGARTSLGIYGKYFDEGSFRFEPITSGGNPDSREKLLAGSGRPGLFLRRLGHGVFDYSRGRWRISARFKSKPLFGLLFPQGVVFQTEICVLRHPAETP